MDSTKLSCTDDDSGSWELDSDVDDEDEVSKVDLVDPSDCAARAGEGSVDWLDDSVETVD